MISHSFPPLFISQSTHTVSTLAENHLSSPAAPAGAHLHGQVQRRVAIAAAGVGVGAVGQQHHGAVQAAPLHGDVQRHVGRAAAGVHLRTVLQQQPRQLLPRARTVAGTDKAAVSTTGWVLRPSRPHGKQSGGTGYRWLADAS